MSDDTPDGKDLDSLGERIEQVERQRKSAQRRSGPAPVTSAGIAFRFAAELVSALIVGGAVGWGLDWLFGHFGFHTRPFFLLLMFLLGAAAGIRNVMRAAKEINESIRTPDDKGH